MERLAEATRCVLGFRFPITFLAVNVHHSLFLSVKFFRKSPPSPVLPPRSISSDMSTSPPIIPSHSDSSANSTPRNQPVDLLSPTTTEIPYSQHERYSSVFCSARSPFTFSSVTKFSGHPLLRLSFHLIPFQVIGRFPHLLIRPILLRLLTSPEC